MSRASRFSRSLARLASGLFQLVSSPEMAGHRTVTHKSVQTVVPLYKALVRPHYLLVTLSKEGHSKHWKVTTKSDQNDSLHICPNLRRMLVSYWTDITGEPPTPSGSARSFQDPERLCESRPSYPLQHERQTIQRTHAETREAKGHVLELRRHFFSNRVIDAWNVLPLVPGRMVEATSTNMFKAALQRLPHGAFKSWKQLPAPRGHLTTRRMVSQVNHR